MSGRYLFQKSGHSIHEFNELHTADVVGSALYPDVAERLLACPQCVHHVGHFLGDVTILGGDEQQPDEPGRTIPQVCWQLQYANLSVQVLAIAERFVVALAAAAQCNAVANLICDAVGTFNRDTAAHPQRAANALVGVFNQHNGGLVFGFYFITVLIRNNEATGGTIASLLNGNCLCHRGI